MTTINLYDIHLAKQKAKGELFEFNEPIVPSYLQEQLQLLVQQKRLELPIQPLLDANPLLATWIEQLEQLFPNLFNPKKKLAIGLPITSRLKVTDNNCCLVETPINVGISKGKPKLFDWSARYPTINWQDQVKLWAATQYFQINPEQLTMIVFALHPTEPPQKLHLTWDTNLNRQTTEWLIELLISDKSPNHQPASTTASELLDIENIDEIAF